MRSKKWYKCGAALANEIDGSRAGDGEALLWFFGQSGFVIKIGTKVLAVDVILHDYVSGGGGLRGTENRRLSPPPFTDGSFLKSDVFLCTHDHADHLNMETLLPAAANNPEALFIVPASAASGLRDAGIASEKTREGTAGNKIDLGGGVSVTPVAAAHSEYLTDDTGADLFLGYIIRGGGVSVYHAGDGVVTERLVKDLRREGPFNVMILPVNGADWERTSRNIIGNMNCEDAAKLALALNADLTVPCHFDFLEGNTINPAHFTDVFYTLCGGKKFHIPTLGERFVYRA